MKLVKSLLLGSAAGLAVVTGAQAADLPMRKAAPAEYVRVCSTYGAGFFYIPGTETCLRVGGRVRADYLYVEPGDRTDDMIGFRARGRIQADARTATAYGLLRTFVRFEITRSSGTPFGNTGVSGTSGVVDQAFIQWGGLTAGRVTSFFEGPEGAGQMGGLRFSDGSAANLLAYTFAAGNGFSATLSLEDGIERRDNGTINYFSEGVDPVTGLPITVVTASPALIYGGQALPDVVGNIRYVGTWGGAQLSGALHQIRSANLVGYTGAAVSTFPDTEYGWAVQGQVYFNLPMIAAGDQFFFNAAYADGALGYVAGGGTGSISAGNATGIVADAYIDQFDGTLDFRRGQGWSLAAGFRHYWTPTVRQNIFGSWAQFEYPATAANHGLVDFTEWRAGTNVIWSPVAGLDLGVEVLYSHVDLGNRLGIRGNEDGAWEGRLRIQRDF